MPKTEVVFFADQDGVAPVLAWLDAQPTKVQDKAIELAISRKAAFEQDPEGHTYRG